MSCRTLQGINLTDNCTSNMGGLKTTVYIGERADIVATANDTTGIVTLAKATGVTDPIAKAFQFRKQSSNLSSEFTADDVNGIYYVTSTLDLHFARQDEGKRLAIQSVILNPDLFAIVQDSNGKIYFLGLDNPVTTTAATAVTGTSFTDANEYTIQLQDMSSELPYFVTESNLAAMMEDDNQ